MILEQQKEQLAIDIYQWCKKNDLWDDNIMYFNGIAWSSSSTWGPIRGYKIDEDLYAYANKNPKDYFRYVNEPHIFSMSFEGGLNHVLNAYTSNWLPLSEEFDKIFKKYRLFYTMGNSWNLTCYNK